MNDVWTHTPEQVVSRLDSYTQDEHIEFIEAARQRTENRRVARRERARAAALRLRDAI